MRDYSLNQKLAKQILDSEYNELFEAIAKESKVSPTTIAAFLTETLKALKRDGVDVEKVSENQLKEIFKSVGSGKLAKEALPEIVSWFAKNEGKSLEEALCSLDLRILSKEEIEKIVDEVIEANKSLVEKMGRNAFGAVMGIVMKKVRGKANAELVNEILKKKLESKTARLD